MPGTGLLSDSGLLWKSLSTSVIGFGRCRTIKGIGKIVMTINKWSLASFRNGAASLSPHKLAALVSGPCVIEMQCKCSVTCTCAKRSNLVHRPISRSERFSPQCPERKHCGRVLGARVNDVPMSSRRHRFTCEAILRSPIVKSSIYEFV